MTYEQTEQDARQAAIAYLMEVVKDALADRETRCQAAQTILDETCGCSCHVLGGTDLEVEMEGEPS